VVVVEWGGDGGRKGGAGMEFLGVVGGRGGDGRSAGDTRAETAPSSREMIGRGGAGHACHPASHSTSRAIVTPYPPNHHGRKTQSPQGRRPQSNPRTSSSTSPSKGQQKRSHRANHRQSTGCRRLQQTPFTCR
jgi:hypothetical protein